MTNARQIKSEDGDFHHELMTMKANAAIDQPDGLLESARKYFGKKKRPCNPSIQQDQAGGHAVHGEWSEKIEADAASGNPVIDFYDQSAEHQMTTCVI